MAHSPYTQTVHSPIKNLESYRDDLCEERVRWRTSFDTDDDAEERLLHLSEDLLKHCDFPNMKVEIKVY